MIQDLVKVLFSCFVHRRDFQSFASQVREDVVFLGSEEIVGKLSVANANEEYLYNRVMGLEKRNQRLEKKVNKLKRKKKELKQEVLKLRSKIQFQGSEEVDDMTGQVEDQGVSKRTLCNILKSLPQILNIRTHHRDARNG